MAKNWIQPGHIITVPAPGNVSSGDVVVAGAIIGIAAGDAASGADLDLALTGIYSLPKVSTDDFSVGEAAYFDDGTGLVTTDDAEGANPKIGVAVTAAANPSAAVNVRLNGSF